MSSATRWQAMAGVRLDKVHKTFPGGVEVVRGITLDAPEGAFIVLVGPSGCGKSTTLRMIAGLESVTSGDIYIGDRRVNDVPPKDRDIAMVFQNYALYPHKTVFKNLSFALELRRTPKREIAERVQEAAEILGISELLGRKPKALSGGQRQRVALGRALVRRPKVFLFDEPLSNLDAKLRVQMRAEIAQLHQRLKSTMVYVTHDQVEAMTLGDRIVVMHDGAVQQDAPPMEAYRRPANRFVAEFIGSPAMNLLEGTLEAAGNGIAFVDLQGSVRLLLLPGQADAFPSYLGKRILLGVRPEHVRLAEAAPGPGRSLAAHVEVVEPLGADILVHLRCGSVPLTARIDPSRLPTVGTRERFAVDVEHLHFFDPESGKALT